MRLRRSNPSTPGYSRRRRGRGFSYHDADGAPLRDPEQRSAKDFRTWHATVLAAVALARVPAAGRGSRTGRRRSVAGAMREVSRELGNTPAVVRSSYVDPRVVEKFGDGETIPESVQEPGPAVERAVRNLLDG